MASKISERIAKAWYESQDFDSINIELYVIELADFLDEKGVGDAFEYLKTEIVSGLKVHFDQELCGCHGCEALRKAGE